MTKEVKDRIVKDKVKRPLLSALLIITLFLSWDGRTRSEYRENENGAGLDSWGALCWHQLMSCMKVCNWSSETVCQPNSHPSLVKCTRGCAHDRNDLIGYFSELCNKSKASFYDVAVCMRACACCQVQELLENRLYVRIIHLNPVCMLHNFKYNAKLQNVMKKCKCSRTTKTLS